MANSRCSNSAIFLTEKREFHSALQMLEKSSSGNAFFLSESDSLSSPFRYSGYMNLLCRKSSLGRLEFRQVLASNRQLARKPKSFLISTDCRAEGYCTFFFPLGFSLCKQRKK